MRENLTLRSILFLPVVFVVALAVPAPGQAINPEFVFGRDYTFERMVATRKVRDAEDKGTIRLVTYVYRPQRNDRHEVVLFSHGSTGGLATSPEEPGGSNAPPRAVVQFFVSRGYTVVAPMRRGRGESTGTYIEECSILKSPTGFCFFWAIAMMSCDRAVRSSSSDGGDEAALSVAIVSCVISMGPPGSAIEIAMPAIIGARRSRAHSSSV